MDNKFYNDIEKAIKALNGEIVLIAIDGMCASGKSTLCEWLAQRFDANCFHMDDFFLPALLKTKQRLDEVGGNVYYERFSSEVLAPISRGESFYYDQYDCKKGELKRSPLVVPKAINFIEGAYSMHPYFCEPYSLTISLAINPNEQIRRITARNGEMMAKRFVDEWIPLENRYFKENSVFSKSDLHFCV